MKKPKMKTQDFINQLTQRKMGFGEGKNEVIPD